MTSICVANAVARSTVLIQTKILHELRGFADADFLIRRMYMKALAGAPANTTRDF